MVIIHVKNQGLLHQFICNLNKYKVLCLQIFRLIIIHSLTLNLSKTDCIHKWFSHSPRVTLSFIFKILQSVTSNRHMRNFSPHTTAVHLYVKGNLPCFIFMRSDKKIMSCTHNSICDKWWDKLATSYRVLGKSLGSSTALIQVLQCLWYLGLACMIVDHLYIIVTETYTICCNHKFGGAKIFSEHPI